MEELAPSLRHALQFVRLVPELPCTDPLTVRPSLPPVLPGAPTWTLVLDLDETLVHCSRGDGHVPGREHSALVAAAPDLVVEFDDGPAFGHVGFRPYVTDFLEAAAGTFEVVVFTASQQGYADKVIDALDPTGQFISHRLYRQHCTECRGAFFKELRLLGRPMERCLLVDNSPISVACDADHGVLIRSWYGDPTDRELLDLLALLEELQTIGMDSDEYLTKRYGLREFFTALRGDAAAPLP